MTSKDRDVWIFAEQNSGDLHPVSYELLGKGRELADNLGGNLCSVLMISDGGCAEELIHRGADKVYLLEDGAFDNPDEILFEKNMITLLREKDPEILLIGATNFGRSLAPRVAASLETGLTADCTGLEIGGDGTFLQIRPAFTGNVLAHISTSSKPKMATVRYREFEEAERKPEREGEIIEKEPEIMENGIEIMERSEEDEINLEDSTVVVSGGRGLKDPSDFSMLRDLAKALGGEVGSSRPLVDEGWIDRKHQVGYSGKRVKPEFYLACGISGASQHLAGMKDSDTIIAINSDPSAPIFNVADYGIVGDLYEVVPLLLKYLRSKS